MAFFLVRHLKAAVRLRSRNSALLLFCSSSVPSGFLLRPLFCGVFFGAVAGASALLRTEDEPAREGG